MRTDFAFFEPHEHARRKAGAPLAIPHLSSNKRGTFTFNLPACQLLGITQDFRRPVRVGLGQSRDDAKEWLLQVVESGGFEVRPLGGPSSGSGYRTPGFTSLALRQHLVAALPYAEAGQTLSLQLDKFSCAAEGGGEAWLLLTAPYCHPPKPKPVPGEKVSRALLLTAPPGLIGVLRGVDVPTL